MWWSVAFTASAFATTVEGAFSAIEVDVPCSVELEAGETDRVELAYTSDGGSVDVTIERGVLEVHGEGSWSDCIVSGTHGVLSRVAASGEARVRVDALQGQASVMVIGSASVEIGMVRADRFKADLAGSAVLEVGAGAVIAARYRVSGASILKASSLKAESVDVVATAGSQASVLVIRRLEAHASGASFIRVDGRPTQRMVRADLSSTVEEP